MGAVGGFGAAAAAVGVLPKTAADLAASPAVNHGPVGRGVGAAVGVALTKGPKGAGWLGANNGSLEEAAGVKAAVVKAAVEKEAAGAGGAAALNHEGVPEEGKKGAEGADGCGKAA